VWWLVGWLAVDESFESGGAVFAVYALLLASIAGGALVERLLPPLPALLGHLLVGFLLRNLPAVGPAVGGAVDAQSMKAMRTAALGVVLARAGLSLDTAAMWRLRWPASRLALLPSSAEMLTVTLVSHPLLGLPWAYALSSFLFCAISPAVTIPGVLALHNRGFGDKTGVVTLVGVREGREGGVTNDDRALLTLTINL